MNDFLNEKFSIRAKNSLISAQQIAQELKNGQIGTDHLFYGIVHQGSSFASEIVLKNKISADAVRLEIIRQRETSPSSKTTKNKISQTLNECLLIAAGISAKYQYQFVGTEHLLYALSSQTENRAQKIMKALGIDKKLVSSNLKIVFENAVKFPAVTPGEDLLEELIPEEFISGQPSASPLESFTVNLTEKAGKGQIDPLIGRQKELDRVISILSRRTKNNPLLIGEPGVGKTAIAEGLALAINQGQVPDHLLDKQVLSLDLALMVAGTMFRGEFENRLKHAIDQITNSKNIILFIDELHTIIGAGSASGSLDAANILKPTLSRGEIRAIGATTLTEYKKYIEQDPAFARRFQTIHVKEPSHQETTDILRGLKKYYEQHHGVKFTDEAIVHAVNLSDRFIQGRLQPDKAIDLLDEAAAAHKAKKKTDKKILGIKKTRVLLEKIKTEKQQAVFSQNFKLATILKSRQIKFEEKLKDLQTKINDKNNQSSDTINPEHIAKTLTKTTGIPIREFDQRPDKKILALEKNLKKKIIGQNQAIQKITASIKRSYAGISSPDRPIGSFMFLGPSGVGKTLLAKELAGELFAPDSLIRIDMSEMTEKHNLSRLLGAPAGYVGFGEGGKLTESIRHNPYSVVLFDEIEKAHPEALNILLQILDEGQITDAMGKTASFRNALIIMTSNIGLAELDLWADSYGFKDQEKKRFSDFESVKNTILKKIRDYFRPEFLNRIDEIIIFNPLSDANLKKITRLELNKIQTILSSQNLEINYPSAVIAHLASVSSSPAEGARRIKKTVRDLIENPLAEQILKSSTIKKRKVKIAIKSQKNKIAGLFFKN